MKRVFARVLWAAFLLVGFIGLAPESASAASQGRAPITGGTIGSQKRLGIGLQSGTLNGLSLKYFFNESTAIQLGLGGGPWGTGLNAEYLVHPYSLANSPGLSIPMYVGVGVGVGTYKHYDYDGLNVHVPLGIAFEFSPLPLDIFMQLEPGIGIGSNYFSFYVGATGGARIYF